MIIILGTNVDFIFSDLIRKLAVPPPSVVKREVLFLDEPVSVTAAGLGTGSP